MPDYTSPSSDAGTSSQQAEIARLNKIIKVLMDRAERSTNAEGSEFCLFQTALMLEEQVRRRTEELEAALDENEAITRALRKSEAQLRAIADQSLVGIAITEQGTITFANPKFAEMFGYSPSEILQLSPLDIVALGEREKVGEIMRQRLSGQVDCIEHCFRGLRKNRVEIEIQCYGSVIDVGGQRSALTVVIDITERIRAERELRALQEQLRELAIHDPMTGLYNRHSLGEFFDRELSLAERHRRPISIFMADLDHFKTVNDTYGHLAGDEVLKVFADLIKRSCRASDICCRYGGEEFLVVLPGLAYDPARARAEQLRAAIENTCVSFQTSTIQVTASFGIAAFPLHEQTRDGLIAAADQALYAAKKAGRNRVHGAAETLAARAP